MKRLIISQRHLNCLNEENTINIAAQAKDNSLSSFSTAASDTNTMSTHPASAELRCTQPTLTHAHKHAGK